jgi:DNA mismatch endonuclease (patch repair protein)
VCRERATAGAGHAFRVAAVERRSRARVRLVAAHTRSGQSLVPFKRGTGATTLERSERMGHVRQAKTAPEESVARWLREHNLGYRRNVRSLPGRPDFANRRGGFAIFVHGCFWHRHPGCPRTTTPFRNREFWLAKFAANLERDAARTAELERAGLHTITVWECESEDIAALDEKLSSLVDRAGVIPVPSGCAISVRTARGARALDAARPEGEGS